MPVVITIATAVAIQAIEFAAGCQDRMYRARGFVVFMEGLLDALVPHTTQFVTHYNFLRRHLAPAYGVPPLRDLSSITTLQAKCNKITEIALAV